MRWLRWQRSGREEAFKLFLCLACFGFPSVASAHRAGVEYASRGDFKEAEEWFKKRLEVDTKDATSASSLAVIHDYDSGVISREFTVSFFSAINLLQDGDVENGIKQLGTTIAMDPGYARPYNVLGVAYASGGEAAKAVSSFQQALQINPHYAEARFNLAALYQSLGKTEDAIRCYKEALIDAPGSTDALINIATLHASLEHYQDAIGYFQEALKTDRGNPDVHYSLALAYFMSGQVAQFKESLLKAQSLYQQKGDAAGLQKTAEYMEKIKEIEDRIKHVR